MCDFDQWAIEQRNKRNISQSRYYRVIAHPMQP